MASAGRHKNGVPNALIGPDKLVESFLIDEHARPRLWKAQRAFGSGCLLLAKDRTDCAANRFYYALIHLVGDKVGTEKTHGDVARVYATQCPDPERVRRFWESWTHAQQERNRADYKPFRVEPARATNVANLVANFIADAMKAEGIIIKKEQNP